LNGVYHDDINVSGRLEKAVIEDIVVNETDITLHSHLSGVLDASAGL